MCSPKVWVAAAMGGIVRPPV
eukprot:COSAG03_NODE_22333_length_292_cov_0.927461_1_plen_20_part_10